jgi:spermidine synthase
MGGLRRRSFVGLYTASGAAALVYEVTWTRLFSLQLGHTVAAATTVLAAFMGGLAIGAWIAGTRGWKTLRAYAALELAVAIVALLLPFALRATTPLLAWAYGDSASSSLFAFVRIGISLVLLGVPAAAMGATFPIAAAWYASAAADVGALYAANTAGAAAGAVAAGFWLIPAFGLRATTWVGVGLNVFAATGAIWLVRLKPDTTHDGGARTKKSPRPQRPPRLASPMSRLALVAVAISGFTALVYEVAWTRLLAMIIGPTTYAFATMAAAFVAGLAIGSAAGTRVVRRTSRPGAWLGAMLMASGLLAAVAATVAATQLPLRIASQVADANVVFERVVVAEAFDVALLLLPMTLALGATFPIALAAAAATEVGRDTARVYAANTLGAIAGALSGGFLFIPAVGLRSTFDIAAAIAIVSGVVCVWRVGVAGDIKRPGLRAAVAGGAALAVVAALPSWDHALLASGAYKYAPYLAGADLDAVLRAGRLEYYREGAAGTVSVRVLTGTRALAIDGKVDASDGGDMLTQRLLGLLPVLIHGRAKEICIIGLGSGVTSASALAPGTVEREDVIEISPEVVEASRFFNRENGDVLRQPAVRLVIGDGRSHLLLTPRQYDVIVSEPSNPWMAGVATLFTREFFEAARARLKPDGLLCQWAHTYDIASDDLKSIVRTFASVFPQGTMWLVGEGDLLLVGAKDGPIAPRLAAMADGATRGTTTAMLDSLGAVEGRGAFGIASLYAGGPAELAAFADAAPIQVDDRTALEYSAPRGIYGRTASDNAAAIRALQPTLPPALAAIDRDATPADWCSRGAMLLRAEAFGLAYDAYRRALALDPASPRALSGFSTAAAGARRQAEAREALQTIAKSQPANAAVRVELSHLLAAGGDLQGALAAAGEALHIAPQDPGVAEQVASVLADASDAERLTPIADALTQRFPDRPDARYYLATSLYLRGKTEDAIAALRHVVDAHPDHARAQNLLGAACATAGQPECARAAFEAAIRANPRDPSAYVNLGVFRLQVGNAVSAIDAFSEALALDPQSTAARNGLAQARAGLQSNPR